MNREDRAQGMAVLRSVLGNKERKPFQVSGEAVFPWEAFDVIPCPRCKGSGSVFPRDKDGPCTLCQGCGELRKLTQNDGWYVTRDGIEVYY